MNRAVPALTAIALLAGAAFLASSALSAESDTPIDPAPTQSPAASAAPVPSPSAPATPPSSLNAAPAVDAGIVAGARADASVRDVLAVGAATQTLVTSDGAWARLDIATEADGLIVVLKKRGDGWQVADAGGVEVGCPVAPSAALDDLGLDCA